MTSAWERHIQDFQQLEESSRLLDKDGMYEMHGLLHRLWSKAVGPAGYDKEEWKRLEELVEKAFRTILGPDADKMGYMALITPKQELQEQIRRLVLGFFDGNEEKTDLWFKSQNPLLGGISPEKMIAAGREERLLIFVQQQLAENEGPHTV